MAPPTGRRVRPVMGSGDVLAGRYRLVSAVSGGTDDESLAADDAGATLWKAQDEVLNRAVAVKVRRALGNREAASARSFLEAAAVAGGVPAPAFARVYDAALEERPAERYGKPAGTVDVAYVVSEWVEGRNVADLLDDEGPLEPRVAVAVAVELAETLAAAHARGTAHGRLHPGNVLVTAPGRPKITDTAVAAALRGEAVAATPEQVAADTRDLAAVLYALLTGRWPEAAASQPSGGVPAAPTAPGRPPSGGPERRQGPRVYAPRQVRAGVPRAVDAAVHRALEPSVSRGQQPFATPAELARALESALASDYPVRLPPVQREPRIPPRLRRRLPLLGVVTLLVVVGAGTYLLGLLIGAVQQERDPFQALVEAPASPAPDQPGDGGQRLDLAGFGVRDFDPLGDGRENAGTIGNAFDGDGTTSWQTEPYNSAAFGGLKPGVGLLVDLGEPTSVSRVELVLTSPGVDLELRVADEESEDPEAYRVVAGVRDAPSAAVLAPEEPTTARYWLVWVTRLPPTDDRFRAGIADMSFLRG